MMRRLARSPAAESSEGHALRPHLVLRDGPATDQIEVPAGEFFIGRQDGLDLVLDSSLVSRVHAKIRNDDGGVTVEDLGSTHGTWVGQARIEGATQLRPGDQVRIGDVTLTYSMLAPDTERPEGRSGSRWWVDLSNRAKTAVLTAGALAAAIGAVVALWPDPDQEDAARVNTVQVLETRMPLSRYETQSPSITPANTSGAPEERSEVPLLSDVILASARASTAAAASSDSSGSATPSPTRSSSPTDPTSTEPSPTDLSPTSRTDLPTGFEVYQSIPEIGGLVKAAPDDFFFPVPTAPPTIPPTTHARSLRPQTGLIVAAGRDEEGNPVDKDLAARRLVALLRQVRTVPVNTPDGVRKDPVGALVDVDLELSGLRNKTVSLSWQVRRIGSEEPLYGPWTRQVESHRLTATTEHDTATVTDMWVPVPRQPGRYVIVAQISLGDSVLDRGTSDPFS